MTNAELAILSLILEQPRHGYEIEQVIEERGMRDWTEVGFSSIYYLLKKLEKEGLIKGRLQQQPGRGPARKVYQVTEKGRERWHTATIQALSQPQRPYAPFQLALANLPGLTKDETITAVRQYKNKLNQQRDYVLARRQAAGHPLPSHVQAMFDLSLTLITAELSWLENFIEELNSADS